MEERPVTPTPTLPPTLTLILTPASSRWKSAAEERPNTLTLTATRARARARARAEPEPEPELAAGGGAHAACALGGSAHASPAYSELGRRMQARLIL